MPPQAALLLFTVGIAGLFLLDRDRTTPTSLALWLPIIWLMLGGSRNVSVWLGAPGTRSRLTRPSKAARWIARCSAR